MFDTTYLLSFFKWLNNDILAIPGTLLFFGVSIVLTIKTKFLQIRAFPAFIRLIIHGLKQESYKKKSTSFGNAINRFHAIFTALGTSIGVGTIVSPGIAIATGCPELFFGSLSISFSLRSPSLRRSCLHCIHVLKTRSAILLAAPWNT